MEEAQPLVLKATREASGAELTEGHIMGEASGGEKEGEGERRNWSWVY